MNFSQIFNGMVGRDFIKAFNDNFTIADEAFLNILATLIYKIKSTDIKEFRVIDNVVCYTLEEEPTEGEDDREWVPVDITQWGNINGDISNQTDLMDILNDKAAVETVSTLSNLVSTLSTNYTALRERVLANETTLNEDTNDIADMQILLETAVQSTTIKAIRLNNSVFQWSPDGRTWYEQPTTNTVAWGRITGDITTQQDLQLVITGINNDISTINTTITGINNDISSLQSDVSSLSSSLTSHINDFTAYQQVVSNALSAIRTLAEDTQDIAQGVSDDLDDHLADTNNPHGVTKAQVLLGNVDNTSDMNKPLSTAQKNYVDTQINNVREEIIDRTNLVSSSGFVDKLFVGNATEYSNVGSLEGMLAFVLDDTFFSATVILTSQNYQTFDLYKDNVIMTPDVQTAESKIYNVPISSSIFTIKVDVDGTLETYNVELSYKVANNINIDELVEGGNE